MAKSDTRALVPDDFDVPQQLIHASFRLEPLGVEHNERDYAAWTGSMDHIQSTPGFVGEKWPHAMSLAENHGDLAKHADDFAQRRGFTYTVLHASDDVIGCVYIYPGRTEQFDARVTSWVRVEQAALDRELYHAVTQWLAKRWPFARVDYAARDQRASGALITSPPSTR
jgi:hypothetical protein